MSGAGRKQCNWGGSSDVAGKCCGWPGSRCPQSERPFGTQCSLRRRSSWLVSPARVSYRYHHAGHAAARCPAVVHAGRSDPVLGLPSRAVWGPAAVLEAEGWGVERCKFRKTDGCRVNVQNIYVVTKPSRWQETPNDSLPPPPHIYTLISPS